VIAVVGSPVASRTAGGVTAAGMPVAVAREAARAGAAVELNNASAIAAMWYRFIAPFYFHASRLLAR